MDFFSNGVTWAILNFVGNLSVEKERFARLARIGKNTGVHDLSKDVGMKSRGEDLAGMLCKRCVTAAAVTQENFRIGVEMMRMDSLIY